MTSLFNEGTALLIDTEMGLAGPKEVAELLKEACEMSEVDDLDRTVLLQTASAVSAMQAVMDQAINLLNTVAKAQGEDVRLAVTKLSMGLAIIIPRAVEVDEDGNMVDV